MQGQTDAGVQKSGLKTNRKIGSKARVRRSKRLKVYKMKVHLLVSKT